MLNIRSHFALFKTPNKTHNKLAYHCITNIKYLKRPYHLQSSTQTVKNQYKVNYNSNVNLKPKDHHTNQTWSK